jgi:hypothetical protein
MLDAFVGATVALRETHRTWAVDVRSEGTQGLVRSHAKGTRMIVRSRMRERLLATSEEGFVMLVRREWLTVLALPEPTPSPEMGAAPPAEPKRMHGDACHCYRCTPKSARVAARAVPESVAKARAKTHPYHSACNCYRCRRMRRKARLRGVTVESLLRAPRRL